VVQENSDQQKSSHLETAAHIKALHVRWGLYKNML